MIRRYFFKLKKLEPCKYRYFAIFLDSTKNLFKGLTLFKNPNSFLAVIIYSKIGVMIASDCYS